MFQTTNLSGFGSGAAGGACTPNTIVVVSGETLIGNMTEQSGLAAAFDGDATKTSGECAGLASGVGYAGVDWGAGNEKLIDKFEITDAVDNGLSSAETPATMNIKLQGSQNNSDWTDLHTDTATNNVIGMNTDVFDPLDDATTAYRYHRVEFEDLGGVTLVAEITFYECT